MFQIISSPLSPPQNVLQYYCYYMCSKRRGTSAKEAMSGRSRSRQFSAPHGCLSWYERKFRAGNRADVPSLHQGPQKYALTEAAIISTSLQGDAARPSKGPRFCSTGKGGVICCMHCVFPCSTSGSGVGAGSPRMPSHLEFSIV